MKITRTESVYFLIRSKAKRTVDERFGYYKIGDEFTIYLGTYGGPDYGDMPCWSDYSKTHFKTPEEGKKELKYISNSGYGFEIIPNTVEVVCVTEVIEHSYEERVIE